MAKYLQAFKVGTPHLGNLLGAIIPAIQLSNDPKMNHSSLPICILSPNKNGELLERITLYSSSLAGLWIDVKVVLQTVGRATNSGIVLVFELFFPFNV
jgi:hypothetical protein